MRDNLEMLYGAIGDGAIEARIPKHARKELEAYLDCGLLCRGFARVRCRDCPEEFLHHRELLGALSLAAYQTVKALMVAAVANKGFRPGMVSVVQTFEGRASFHPHVHALARL